MNKEDVGVIYFKSFKGETCGGETETFKETELVDWCLLSLQRM